MKSLVIGMGIGQLYKSVLTQLNYEVCTVDSDINKNADFPSIESAILFHGSFDTVHICTPNFTHEPLARSLAPFSKIIFIEKPGVKDSNTWKKLIEDFPNTRFMMIKNNQYRNEIKMFKEQSEQSETVYVRWNNANRIPSPGSWFTTKNLSFGGVSRDLLPHMLSYYCTLTNFTNGELIKAESRQNNRLEDIHSTDYGIVNPNGTFDVDDYCYLEFKNNNVTWILTANWKTNLDHDDSSIAFSKKNSSVRHELGLCPEHAYKKMIVTAVENLNNNSFWNNQFEQDMWIHRQIENL